MAHNHEHGHNHSHREGNIRIAFFLNLLFTIIELVGGVFTNSIAIISDAVHDFGDCLSLGLAWYFQKLSQKGSTRKYTYGYKRFSLLGAITNSVVLIVGSIFIITEAIPRLSNPQETNADGMLILSIIGIVLNGIPVIRMLFTKRSSSINERVVSLHLLEDALGWVAVLVGSIIMRFTGLAIIDPILSLAIAAFVLFNVFKNIKLTLPILLQGAPADINHEHIIEKLQCIKEIAGIHDLHIWALDDEYNVLTVHIALSETLPMTTLTGIKSRIRKVLEAEGVQHATIEFEAPDENCGFEDCI